MRLWPTKFTLRQKAIVVVLIITLFSLGIMMMLLGAQSCLFGSLAELVVLGRDEPPYSIRRIRSRRRNRTRPR